MAAPMSGNARASSAKLSEVARIKDGTGKRTRGRVQVEKIIATAKELLIEEGYSALTIRNVAAKMAVSTGNVTYYFKRQQDLFNTIFDEIIDHHKSEFERKTKSFPNDPKARFESYVDVLLTECKDPKTRAFFYQLWAVSVHDPYIQSLRDRLYALFLEEVETLLRPLLPELSLADVRGRAFVFCTIIEGLHVLLGIGAGEARKYRNYEATLHDQLKKLTRP